MRAGIPTAWRGRCRSKKGKTRPRGPDAGARGPDAVSDGQPCGEILDGRIFADHYAKFVTVQSNLGGDGAPENLLIDIAEGSGHEFP